jgi:hypothetical protein
MTFFGGAATLQYLNWLVVAHAMQNLTPTCRQWVTNQVSGRAAVGRWMLRCGE